jgi:hypothetical protein
MIDTLCFVGLALTPLWCALPFLIIAFRCKN